MRHALALILLLTVAGATCAQELTIVADGASDYQIVLGAEPTRVSRMAADELRTWIAAATGVELPIVGAADPGARHLYVGPSAVPANWALDLTGVPDEGFVVKTVGADIAFAGVDDGIHPEEIPGTARPTLCGTMNAVYDFLEERVGVRWYWHDDLGTIVPETDTLTTPPLNYSEAPAFIYRALPYGPQVDGQQVATRTWGRRNRLGKSIQTYHSHSWFQHLNVEQYGAEHPEYCALVNGRRVTRYYSGSHGGQVCTTNPEVVEVFRQACLNYFRTHADRTMCSVSPNDGGGFCECDDCRALDLAMWPEDSGSRAGQPQMADRMLTFYNQIAEATAAEFPERYLGAYVYSYYSLPPLRVQPHPNLALVLAINSAWHGGAPQLWDRDREMIDGWAAIHRNMFMYDIFYHGTAQMGFPQPIVGHTIEYLRHIRDLGYRGGYLYIGPTWESLGPGAYLMSKLLWDPQADPEPILAAWYADLYGPAAADVRAYEELVERSWVAAKSEQVAAPSPEAAHFLAKAVGGASYGVLLNAWEPILPAARATLERALAAATDADDRARVQRVFDQFEFAEASVAGLQGVARFEASRAPDPAVVAQVRAAIERREAVIERIGSTWSPYFRDWVRANDESVKSPLRRSAAYFALAGEASRVTLSAARVDQPPAIDGDPSDAVWAQAPAVAMRENMGAAEARAATTVQAAFDDRALYLLVTSAEPEMARVEASSLPADHPDLFRTDNVEVLVDPDGDGRDYLHLAVNTGGSIYDGRSADPQAHDAAWTGDWQHAVARTDDGWTVELAVPYATLGVEAPAEGASWRMNVHRTRRAVQPNEYQALSPTLGGYHQPAMFGELRFGATAALTGENVLLRWDPERYDVGADIASGFRVSGEGEFTVAVADDRAYEGTKSLKVTVAPGGMASFTWYPASVEPGSYRLAMRYYADPLAAAQEGRPAEVPITRVICRDAAGQAVTESRDYSWERSPAEAAEGAWADHIHVFRTAPGTERFTVTVFVHRPGTYWFDDISLVRF